MSLNYSRRKFSMFVPVIIALFSIARGVFAQNPPQGQATTDPTGNRPPGSGSSGGGYGHGTPPGPAGHDGDFRPGKVTGMGDREHLDQPAKPKKNLAADQRTMRSQVEQLVRESHELSKAMEGFGPKQPLSSDMIGKTKEIEKLAHDIAELAKG